MRSRKKNTTQKVKQLVPPDGGSGQCPAKSREMKTATPSIDNDLLSTKTYTTTHIHTHEGLPVYVW